MAETMRLFDELCIGASVFLVGTNQQLEVSEDGIIMIPEGRRPQAFKLSLLIPKNGRIFINQKEVSQEQGEYHGAVRTGRTHGDFVTYTMLKPIQVKRATNREDGSEIVWTNWHGKPGEKPNRVDIWCVFKNGEVWLFQVGVITHDNGKTFRIHGEFRYRGQLYLSNRSESGYVVAPRALDRQVWGPFTTWQDIFNYSKFKDLVRSASLQPWTGKLEELEPPLQQVTMPGFAVVKFYIPFGGFAGWGKAFLRGQEITVLGTEILDPVEEDGIKRLRRGDVISYEEEGRYGDKEERCLRRIKKVS